MSAHKPSSFPAVLKTYLPEYEQPIPKDKENEVEERGIEEEKSDAISSVESSKEKSNKTPVKRIKRQQTRGGSSDHYRRQELEHYRRNFENWHQIQAEVQEEQRRKLRCKIGLQKELIKKQDELHQMIVEQGEEALAQERKQQKNAWKAQTRALEDHCKNSLNKRKPKPKSGKSQSTSVSKSSPVMRRRTVSPTPQYERSAPLHHHLHHHHHAAPSPGLSVKEEEDEEEEDEISLHEDIPWHHDQLYKLYGKKADYFLHPKIEVEKRRMINGMNPNLKKYGGRVGANYLWSTLRNDSMDKLTQADASIPQELKSAYSAFVRQQLTMKRKPIKRNFYAEEDVPDMDRLIDQSRMHAAKEFKYQVDLMFRSSQANEDRSGVLIYNNPFPTQEICEEEEGVGRYMPSWAEPTEEDVQSHHSYTKWIQNMSPRSETRLSKKLQKDSSAVKLPKCVFLTEKDATVEGEFSKRHKEMEDAKHNPFLAAKRLQCKSAMGVDTAGQQDVVARPNSESTWNTASKWQPLSLSALAEYSQEKPGLGEGAFNQGQPPVWPTTARA